VRRGVRRPLGAMARVLSVSVAFAGCTTYFPHCISTTQLADQMDIIGAVSGESRSTYIFIVGPFGEDSLKAAVADALAKSGGDALVNVTVDLGVTTFPFPEMITNALESTGYYRSLYRSNHTYVYGIAVRYKKKDGGGAKAPAAARGGDTDYRSASALYRSGDYDGALEKLRPLVRDYPNNWEAWQLVGNCQYAKGDTPGTLQSFRWSLKINPDNQELKSFVESIEARQ